MALSVSSITMSSGFYTPVEEQFGFPFDWDGLLFHYLRLLQFDFKAVHKQHHVNLNRETFKTPNIKAFQLVTHFLFTKLDRERAKKMFMDVWPIFEKKQEAGYRKKVQEWCTEIQSNNKESFPHVNPAIFMQPGGSKFAQLLCHLASHVLGKMPQCSKFIRPPNTCHVKPGISLQYQLNLIKGTLAVKQKKWKNLYDTFGQVYCSRKQLTRHLIKTYRDLCQEEEEVTKDLFAALDSSSFKDKEKLVKFDANEYQRICQELSASTETIQTKLNHMEREITAFARPFEEAKDIIKSTLDLKERRPSIDGKAIVKKFPSEYIERYQNLHAGTRLELQLKNGCYDFLPVFNLLLFAVPMVAEVSKSLEFPPLDDEIAQLRQLEDSIRSNSQRAIQLGQRWSQIEEDQATAIESLLRSKVSTGDIPMALLPYTPVRSLLPADLKVTENSTPPAMRAVLSLQTPSDLSTKPQNRLSVNGAFKASQEQSSTYRENRRSNGHAVPGKLELRIGEGRRRSREVELDFLSKKSLTPDPSSRRGSFNHTPIGVKARINRPGTSSLAASPILERVMLMSGPSGASPLPPKQQTRRSLPQNAVATAKNVAALMMDRAAEGIVFDLVRFDSPCSGSSEKGGLWAKELMARSPRDDEKNLASNGSSFNSGSNLDLLRVLEGKFASPTQPLRYSPLFNGHRMAEGLECPAQPFDYNQEIGLLDASGASLIDDILDLSLGM